jgi:hypothetical protein
MDTVLPREALDRARAYAGHKGCPCDLRTDIDAIRDSHETLRNVATTCEVTFDALYDLMRGLNNYVVDDCATLDGVHARLQEFFETIQWAYDPQRGEVHALPTLSRDLAIDDYVNEVSQ